MVLFCTLIIKKGVIARRFYRYDELLREKEELEAAYGKFQLEVKHSQTGNATKEIRVLKKVIHNLEVRSR